MPRIVVAGRFALVDRAHETRYCGPTHALHLHDYSAELRTEAGTQPLAQGDVTLSPAGSATTYALDAPGRHWCIHFLAPADVVADDAPLAIPVHSSAATIGGGVRERMAHVAALHARSADDRLAAVAAGLALQELLLWLADRPRSMLGARVDTAAEQAAAIIDTRFAEPLDPATIAAAVGRSPAYLARIFRTRFGTTIPHRLIRSRAQHARYLLESTDLPIWRIAERVGIPDAQHFNKTLRRLLGASPSAIRARSVGKTIDADR
ncbi:helix-turn-helix transcriptional regulator [Sphingomonas sp. BIUV-7]|uniref:Helix-turn-helix transcriptional regulator n=1 Tax=Sphingomonas natans TaxID=3063330 RepID=A0ABT8Y7J8_9SPHN|nr:helix-turn-helix transcriptional regulator [Sphingomonas sp. BIUV-7]MDO6414274.1 helix-turn-helix transcriptional regulator [Sphingomonas sp. BIUV-7]